MLSPFGFPPPTTRSALVPFKDTLKEHMELFALLLPPVTSQQAHSWWTMFTDATNTNGYLLSSEHHLPPGFSYEYSHEYSSEIS